MGSKSFATLQLYLNWANSVLCERSINLKGIEDLAKGPVFGKLIDTLWPAANLSKKIEESEDQSPEGVLAVLQQYLRSAGIKYTINPKAILDGELKSILELLWTLILNFSVHTPKLSAFQRNPKMGTRLVLNWCRELLPQLTVDHTDTLVNNIVKRDCVLIDLISSQCAVKYDADTVVYLANCFEAAEQQFGVKKNLLNPEKVLDKSVSEEALLIYLTLLRRKVKQKDDGPRRRELRAAATAEPPKLGMSTPPRAVTSSRMNEEETPALGHDPSGSDPPGAPSQQPGLFKMESTDETNDTAVDTSKHVVTDTPQDVVHESIINSKEDADKDNTVTDTNGARGEDGKDEAAEAKDTAADNEADEAEQDSGIDNDNRQTPTPTDPADQPVNNDADDTSESPPESSESPRDEEHATTSSASFGGSTGEVSLDLTVTGHAIKRVMDENTGSIVSAASCDSGPKNPISLQDEIDKVVRAEQEAAETSDTDSVTEVKEHMAELLDTVDFVDGSTLNSTFEGGVFHISSCSEESDRDEEEKEAVRRLDTSSDTDAVMSSNPTEGEAVALSMDPSSDKEEALGQYDEIDFSNDVICAEPYSVGDDDTSKTILDDTDTNVTLQRDVSMDVADDLTADIASELSYQDSEDEAMPTQENNNNTFSEKPSLVKTDSIAKESLIKSLTFGSLTAEDLRLNLGDLGASMESEDLDWDEDSLNTLICSGIEDMFEQSGFSKSDARDMLKQAAVQDAVKSTIQEQMQLLSSRRGEKTPTKQRSLDEPDPTEAENLQPISSLTEADQPEGFVAKETNTEPQESTTEDRPEAEEENTRAKTEEPARESEPEQVPVEAAEAEVTDAETETAPPPSADDEHRASSPLVSAGDELLHLLDNIGQKGESIRGELEMAQIRESMLKNEIELDEQCINQVHETFNTELEQVQYENEQLTEQLSSVSSEAKENKEKAGQLESVVERLQGHVDHLAKQVAEANYREQMRTHGQKTISVTTEMPFTLNVGVQVDSTPLLYDQGVQVSLAAAEVTQAPAETPIHSTPIHSPRALDSPSRATTMIDKILKQMSNIAESSEPQTSPSARVDKYINVSISETIQELEAEPEGLDKWRRLAMTHLTSDPHVLALQKSLASATLENDLIQTKLNKLSKESIRKMEELNREAEEAQMGLLKANEQNEILRVRNEGDQAEMDILKDKLASAEKRQSVAQIENEKLSTKLGSALPTLRTSLDESATEAAAVDNEYQKVRKQLGEMEEERQKLTKNFESLQEDHSKSLETCNDLEANLAGVASEKTLLEAEVLVLRDEYKYLKKGMEVLEKFFKLKVLEDQSAKSGLNPDTSVDIEELKQHVFGQIQAPRHNVSQPSSVSASAKPGKSDSLHEDIMKQSELVLKKLIEGPQRRDPVDEIDPDTIVHWSDVRRSIADKLMTESKENVAPKIDISGKDKARKKSKSPKSGEEPSDIITEESLSSSEFSSSSGFPANVTELVADIQKQTGAPIEIVVNSSDPDSITLKLNTTQTESGDDSLLAELADAGLPDCVKLDLRKISKEKMEEAYDELRRRRLNMLVQAYTGRSDAEKLLAKVKDAQSKVDETPKPPATSSSIISEALTSQKARDLPARESLAVQKKLEAQMIADSQLLAEQSKRIKDKLLAMKDNFSSQRDDYMDTPYRGSEVPRVTTPKGSQRGGSPRSSRRGSGDSESSMSAANIRNQMYSGPKRQIYPHKKNYENSNAWHQKRYDEEEEMRRYEEELADWTANSKVRPLANNQSLNQSYDYPPEEEYPREHRDPRVVNSMLEDLRHSSESPKKSLTALDKFRMANKPQAPPPPQPDDRDRQYREEEMYDEQDWDEDWEPEEDGQTYLDYVRAKFQKRGADVEDPAHVASMITQGPTPNKFQKFVAKHRGKAIRRELLEKRPPQERNDQAEPPMSLKELDGRRQQIPPPGEYAARANSLEMSGVQPLQRSGGTLPSSQTLKYPIEEKTRQFLDDYVREKERSRSKVEADLKLLAAKSDHISTARGDARSETKSEISLTGEYASLPATFNNRSGSSYTADPKPETRYSSSSSSSTLQVKQDPSSQDYRPRERSPYSSFTDYTKHDPSAVTSSASQRPDYRSSSSREASSPSRLSSASSVREPEVKPQEPRSYPPSSKIDIGSARDSSRDPSTKDPASVQYKYHGAFDSNPNYDAKSKYDSSPSHGKTNGYDGPPKDARELRREEPTRYSSPPARSYKQDTAKTSSTERVSLNAKPAAYTYTTDHADKYRKPEDARDRASQLRPESNAAVSYRGVSPHSQPRISGSDARDKPLSRGDSHSAYLAYVTQSAGIKDDDFKDTRPTSSSDRHSSYGDREPVPPHDSDRDKAPVASRYSNPPSTSMRNPPEEEPRGYPDSRYTARDRAAERTAREEQEMFDSPRSSEANPDEQRYSKDLILARRVSKDESDRGSDLDFVVTRGGDIVSRKSPKLSGSSRDRDDRGYVRSREEAGRRGESRDQDLRAEVGIVVSSEPRRTTTTSYATPGNYSGSYDKKDDSKWDEPRGYGEHSTGGRDSSGWSEPKKFLDSYSATETAAAQDRHVRFDQSLKEKEARSQSYNSGSSLSSTEAIGDRAQTNIEKPRLNDDQKECGAYSSDNGKAQTCPRNAPSLNSVSMLEPITEHKETVNDIIQKYAQIQKDTEQKLKQSVALPTSDPNSPSAFTKPTAKVDAPKPVHPETSQGSSPDSKPAETIQRIDAETTPENDEAPLDVNDIIKKYNEEWATRHKINDETKTDEPNDSTDIPNGAENTKL